MQCHRTKRGATWHSLPAEVQGRIFAEIDDEVRCKIIPVLSKEMLRVHLTYPPRRRRWLVQHRVTSPMVEWSMLISDSLEHFDLCTAMHFQDHRPQLLMALRWAPKLQSVTIRGHWSVNDGFIEEVVLRSLGFLTQIRELTLKGHLCHGGFRGDQQKYHPFKSLAQLKSLEVINLQSIEGRDLIIGEATELSAALARLAKLNKVKFGCVGVTSALARLLSALPALTQISDLTITTFPENRSDQLGEAAVDLSALGSLSQLTSLSINIKLPFACYAPVFSLPNLCQLRLHVSCGYHGNISAPWHLASAHLADIEFFGGPKTLVNACLPKHGLYASCTTKRWHWTPCASGRCLSCSEHHKMEYIAKLSSLYNWRSTHGQQSAELPCLRIVAMREEAAAPAPCVLM